MRMILVASLFVAMLAGCTAPEAKTDDAVTEPTEPMTPRWGAEADAILRPGAPIGWCTYNFLFFHPGNGTHYVGTAAHCTELGERMPLAGHGEIGTTVYDTDESGGADAGVDFALIRLDDGIAEKAFPMMMDHAGPTGITEAADVAVGDELDHHGYGMVFGAVEQARSRPGVLLAYGDDFCSQSVVWWGDSGSPVLHTDTGKALGIVSRAGWIECAPDAAPGSQLRGATVTSILADLEASGWPVQLATV